VTTTRVQEEGLFLTKPHVWCNPVDEWAEAAIVVINTGGRDVVIDKITARGQTSDWSNVFYWKTKTETISADLNVTTSELPESGDTVDLSSVFKYGTGTFTRCTDDLTLMSGWTVVMYIRSPDSIAVNDIGTTVGITVFSANAQYYKETNVESS
jgi:hypothetical protein